MLKLKLPLLAVSISMSLLATQSSTADSFKILPLGDSITNGIYNGGNKLSYRDDLYDTLTSGKYDFEFVGRCPDTGATSGSCEAPSAINGKTLNHEGRAGWHANDINDHLTDWLTWYTPTITLLHIGTNDIFNQDNDVDKTDDTIEDITYTTTLGEIEEIIGKLKAKNPDMKIYVAKILPMGKIGLPDNNDKVLYGGDGGDAAKGLNDLMTPAWATANGVKVVDLNTGFNFADHFDEGLVHPNQTAEEIMASRWNDVAIVSDSSITPSEASPDHSIITTSSDSVVADNTATATITLKARFPSGNDLAAGGDTVVFTVSPSTATLTTTVDNNDGTYTTTVKSSQAGDVEISATINGSNVLTGDATVAFAEVQEIQFNPPSSKDFGDEDFTITDVVSQKSNSTDPTGLNVTVVVKPASSTVCEIDANKKVHLKTAGNCTLIASQDGGTANGVTYVAATPVEKTITVNKGTHPVTFKNTPTTAFIGDVFQAAATSTSGLGVSISPATPKICSLDSTGKVTFKIAGTCKLTATQSGDANYKAAKITHSIVVKKTAAQIAKDNANKAVTNVISGTGKVTKVTTAQLRALGLESVKAGTDYSKAIKEGTYADKNNPTVAELQTVIDKANSDDNKSGGSTSPLWLLTLGFVALFRRKEHS